MFTARKLKKVRKEARKQVARTYKEFDAQPAAFGADTPPPIAPSTMPTEISTGLQALQKALGDDDAVQIEQATKYLKHEIDRRVPIWRTSTVLEYAEAIVVALVLALIIRTFIVQAFKIPSGSMIPTLRVGDHILVNKFLYGLPIPFIDKKFLTLHKPQRGDTIVFKFPQDTSKDYIKRIVGVPGDTLEVRGTNVFVNGEEVVKKNIGTYRYEDPHGFEHTGDLYEEILSDKPHLVLYDSDTIRLVDATKTVPESHYFCMGDNRDHSNDSRYWGFVPFELIKGKAVIIYFSWPPGQFTRIGKLLK